MGGEAPQEAPAVEVNIPINPDTPETSTTQQESESDTGDPGADAPESDGGDEDSGEVPATE